MEIERPATVHTSNDIALDAKIHYEVKPHVDINGVTIFDLKDNKRYVDSYATKITIYYPIDLEDQKQYMKIIFSAGSLLDIADEIRENEGEMIKQF